MGAWRGRWTRYKPSGEILESFDSTREFTANPTGTAITQVNRYAYDDGRRVEKRWSFNSRDHNGTDGFRHPASRRMRGLALGNGAAVWLVPSLEPESLALFELFLVRGGKRHSVGVVYGPDGRLQRTASIREALDGHTGTPWSRELEPADPWTLTGAWRAEPRGMAADLSTVAVDPLSERWPIEGNRQHFFPDQIVLSCPERISPTSPFTLAVWWLEDDDMLQQLVVSYDDRGHLRQVIHQDLVAMDR